MRVCLCVCVCVCVNERERKGERERAREREYSVDSLMSMTHSYVWDDSFICVTRLIHMCDMTHSYVTWLICMCKTNLLCFWHDSRARDDSSVGSWHRTQTAIMCLSYLCDMTDSFNSQKLLTYHIRMSHIFGIICDMTHTYVTWLTRMRHDSHVCDMTQPYRW